MTSVIWIIHLGPWREQMLVFSFVFRTFQQKQENSAHVGRSAHRGKGEDRRVCWGNPRKPSEPPNSIPSCVWDWFCFVFWFCFLPPMSPGAFWSCMLGSTTVVQCPPRPPPNKNPVCTTENGAHNMVENTENRTYWGWIQDEMACKHQLEALLGLFIYLKQGCRKSTT